MYDNLRGWIRVSVTILGLYHLVIMVGTTLLTVMATGMCTWDHKYCAVQEIRLASDDSLNAYQQGFNDAKNFKK